MKLSYLLFLFFYFPSFVKSQEVDHSANWVSHITGYEVGYGYPYLTKGFKYSLLDSKYNFGLKGSFLLGKLYDSGNSIMITPTFYMFSLKGTIHRSERIETGTGILQYRSDRFVQFNEASLILPGVVEVQFLRSVSLGVGGYLSMIMAGSGSVKIDDYRLSLLPHSRTYSYSYDERFHPQMGFLTKITLPVIKTEKMQHGIALEYFHQLTEHDLGVHLHWFTLSYSKRNIVTKDKRTRWDRALLRKQHSIY